QLLWADAIFVRDFTRLDTYGDESLLKAAVILDLVYGSYDLVALLLNEYDRRMQTGLRQRYLEALGRRQLRGQFLNVVNYPKSKRAIRPPAAAADAVRARARAGVPSPA